MIRVIMSRSLQVFLLQTLLLLSLVIRRMPMGFSLGRSDHQKMLSSTRLAAAERRQMLQQCAVGLQLGLLSTFPVSATTISSGLSILRDRLLSNSLDAPPYGMEGTDVFYPSWFDGKWKVASTCTDVQAPCGVILFGGNQTFASAKREVGKTTLYNSRFVGAAADDNTVIADREYNVRSIAQAAMGSNSVLDIPLSTPNKLCCILSPEGSPSVLKVDLLIVKRLEEPATVDTQFVCGEVARQIVSKPGSTVAVPSLLLKEVETISIYDWDSTRNVVSCRQRSATFLLPSQQNPQALQMWQASRGRPIDIRFYDVLYTRR